MRRIAVKVAAFGPPVVFSVVVTIVILAALPPRAALVIFLGIWVVAGALMLGFGEGAAARVLFGCRRLRADEVEDLAAVVAAACRVGLGPPVVSLWVRERTPLIAADGLGRRTVVLSSGLVEAVRAGGLPPDQAAAVIVHAAGSVRAGWHRSDPVLGWLTLPWRFLAGVWQAVVGVGRQIPGMRLAWRARIVVMLIAIVQFYDAGQVALMVLLVVIAAVSYGVPYAHRDWARQLDAAGDRAVVEAGLGAPLAALLRRHSPQCRRTRDRVRNLDPPGWDSREVLGLVVSR